MLNEFIKELKENQDVNYKNNIENRVDIDYVIEKLEDIEPTYETIKKDIESLEDYEKSDLIVDLVKNGDPFYIMDNMEYLIENSLDKNAKYDLLNTLIENIKNDIRREYETETKKKDDGFYNVKLNALKKELENIENIIERLEY